MSPPESDWGDLDPVTVEQLKRHVEVSVERGIERAARSPEVREGVSQAMADGVLRALQDDKVWQLASQRAADALRESAKSSAGGMVLEGLKGIARIGFVLLIVYAIAGFPGVASVWKTLTTSQ